MRSSKTEVLPPNAAPNRVCANTRLADAYTGQVNAITNRVYAIAAQMNVITKHVNAIADQVNVIPNRVPVSLDSFDAIGCLNGLISYGKSHWEVHPWEPFRYRTRSCRRNGFSFQNSIVSGTNRNPDQKGGRGTLPTPNRSATLATSASSS